MRSHPWRRNRPKRLLGAVLRSVLVGGCLVGGVLVGGGFVRVGFAASTFASANTETVKYYTVLSAYEGRPENLSEIAVRFLGSGARADEIFTLNFDRVQPDGGRLTDPGSLTAGWLLILPWDAVGEGVVLGVLPTSDAPAPPTATQAPAPTASASSAPASTSPSPLLATGTALCGRPPELHR